ncbi:MAG: hypothetical protein KDI79_27515 [Anaerolineae bacterium]|nr:hypothetical protein [Anaerolineae bacterium]
MNMKQVYSAVNGHPTASAVAETAAVDKTQKAVTDHLEVQRQHQQWLNQARKAQVKNRRLLALLSRLESIVLDRDATLASLMDRIETHDAETKWAAVAPADRSGGSATAHRSYRAEHAAVREIFDQFEGDEEKFNSHIRGVIEALLRVL